MSNTATLVYTATITGPTTQTNLNTAMAAVALGLAAIAQLTGCALTSDTTANSGATQVTRTIVYDLTPAAFQANFPVSSDQSAPFRGLYKETLQTRLQCLVTEAITLT